MGGKRKKFGSPHTEAQKAHLVASKGGVWDKQCVDCRWIYVKFSKACPKCESISWDLVNCVQDPDFEPGASDIPYLPTPEEIRKECAVIREGWDDKRLALQEDMQGWYVPVVEAQKKGPGEESILTGS